MTTNQYSKLSVILHWITAIAVIALFATHDPGSSLFALHVGGGSIVGILLVWRILRRPIRGFADKPDQPEILNLVSTLIMWALLLITLFLVISGYFLPWTAGQPLNIFGIVFIPSFMDNHELTHNTLYRLHLNLGHGIMLLILLHVLGALKHLFFDRDDVMQRIFKSEKGGR